MNSKKKYPIEIRYSESGEWYDMENAGKDVWGVLQEMPHLRVELRVNPKYWVDEGDSL